MDLVFSLMAILIYVVVTLWSLRVLSELAIFTPRLLTLHCWVIYQWCLRHFAELAKFNHLRDILVAARCAQIFKNRGSIASILHHGNSCPTSPGIYIYISLPNVSYVYSINALFWVLHYTILFQFYISPVFVFRLVFPGTLLTSRNCLQNVFPSFFPAGFAWTFWPLF